MMRSLMAASTASGLLAALCAAGAGTAHATSLVDNLTCEAKDAALTFAKGVTDTPAANSYTLTGNLINCESMSGAYPNVDHGTVVAVGSGTLSCGATDSFNGNATFTWYDVSNRSVGTTTVSFQGGGKGTSASGDISNHETGITNATSTVAPLNNYDSSFAPTGFTGSCTDPGGVTALTGDNFFDFSLIQV
ncbi:hypothetical protein [Kitasatospora sp. NPDC058046]|uniref:hypothetical protein n=1 Tax=Kitasatospora sp. NPDC058046 TaxID=3346312 RepID=UPI0036D926E4